ncbi:MAG TPA: 2,3,4,5-tetrahydropyridine-2,6-dicarboxylate N-succinyltransferase [Bryobacterales bacterium]|nr:2,3,4,5-tetrahydropyridine-2,6-dicarboxylate N-succinyltransferase [Bryobacterales bacterium]
MLADTIDRLFAAKAESYGPEYHEAFAEFKAALNRGEVRAAEPSSESPLGWKVNAWVKRGILLGFRIGAVVDMSADHGRIPFFDKSSFPLRKFDASSGVRIVPGGSSIRDGCYVGQGVTCMPPMFINVGAYVDEGTMVDSHALVGSCAQIGKRVHLSAAAQVGGVLEPVGALPVIIEDDALVGGNCGIYEGTIVRRRAVLAAGTILTRSTPVYDVVRNTVHRATADSPLVIPEEAVVIPGARAFSAGPGKDWNLSVYTPVIVKYRDAKTDARLQLEDLLR